MCRYSFSRIISGIKTASHAQLHTQDVVTQRRRGPLQTCLMEFLLVPGSSVPESVDNCGIEQSVHELKGRHLSVVFLHSSVQGGPTVFAITDQVQEYRVSGDAAVCRPV